MTADGWAARLAGGARIDERVAVVVAHPDDESLWAGALLGRLVDGLLIHVTDGAPADMDDAHRLGFASRAAYAAARAGELDRALDALGYGGERRGYGVQDKDAVLHLGALVDRLTADLAGAALVVTHPYEGGHPDHDAAAFAVRGAADRAGVPVVEFACYHLDGERRFGAFAPGPAEQARALEATERARIDAALTAHATQRHVFGDWRPTHERWRPAPRYDFATPPECAVLYDTYGWALTSAEWRAHVSRELAPC